MRRLVIANIILIILLSIIPKPEVKATEVEQIKTEEDSIEQIIDAKEEENASYEIEEAQMPVTTYSQELIEYIKSKEKFKSHAYLVEGETYYTIGYGYHKKSVKSTDVISEEEAYRLLIQELDIAKNDVFKQCDYLGNLSQNELDALVSFTYNGGLGMLQKLTADKTRNKEEMAEHWTAYTNGGMGGLVKRRNEELNLFLGGI